PKAGEAHADLGLFFWRRGEDTKALPHLEKAHAAFPANFRLAAYLSSTYAVLGREEAMKPVLLKTLRMGTPWELQALRQPVQELMTDARTYRPLFEALAEHLKAYPWSGQFRDRAE